jgi:hypothetical protein
LFFMCLSSAAGGQVEKRLWVLHEPDEIVEYDPITFAKKQSVKVPLQAFKAPDTLSINHAGQLLLLLPQAAQAKSEQAVVRQFWLWDGRSAKILPQASIQMRTRAGVNLLTLEVTSDYYLSRSGEGLFSFQTSEKKTVKGDDTVDLSVTSSFRVARTDLEGKQPEQITSESFPECKCETGVCSETCQEATFWAPEEGIDQSFFVTQWIPGQIGSTYLTTSLYQRSQGKWSAKKLPHAMERILDAAERGETFIEATQDAGCCGWENESDDQTVLSEKGKAIVLFDEFGRYDNRNYDVSFYTQNAKLSPDLHRAAFTIHSSGTPGTEIRLSSEGKPNPAELKRIQQALTELPAVEVVSVEPRPNRLVFLPHSDLVGWLNENEVLVLEDHTLVAVHISTGVRRRSQIRVAKDSQAYLR